MRKICGFKILLVSNLRGNEQHWGNLDIHIEELELEIAGHEWYLFSEKFDTFLVCNNSESV